MVYVELILLLLFVSWFLYIPLPWIIGRIIRNRQKARAVSRRGIYLTFDDGPGTRLTPQLLNLFKEKRIRATFFILGRNIPGREDILKAIAEEGHAIASHGYAHDHAWKVMPWKSIADIMKGWSALNDALSNGQKQYFYRPPCGKLNLLSLLFLWISKVPIIFWSADCLDTWPKNVRRSTHAAEQIRTDGGGIVLFHDFDRSTDETDRYVLDSVKAVIDTGQTLGLSFLTIDQLVKTDTKAR